MNNVPATGFSGVEEFDDLMEINLYAHELGASFRKAVEKSRAIPNLNKGSSGTIDLYVKGESSLMCLSLISNATQFTGSTYLRLVGNPYTFLRKGSAFEMLHSANLILECFRRVVEEIEFTLKIEMPSAVRKALIEGSLEIHSLRFGAYSTPVDKLKYLTSVNSVYAYSERRGGVRHSMTSMLDISTTPSLPGYYVGVNSSCREPHETRLVICDKEEELSEAEGSSEDLPEWIRPRLRYDLFLNDPWCMNRNIVTLKDFAQFVESNGGLLKMVMQELNNWIHRACLSYMFTIRKADLKAWLVTGIRPSHMREDLDFDTQSSIWMALALEESYDARLDTFITGLKGNEPAGFKVSENTWIPQLEIDTKGWTGESN